MVPRNPKFSHLTSSHLPEEEVWWERSGSSGFEKLPVGHTTHACYLLGRAHKTTQGPQFISIHPYTNELWTVAFKGAAASIGVQKVLALIRTHVIWKENEKN